MRNGMRTAIAALATLAMTTPVYAQKAEHYQIRHAADLAAVCSTPPSAADYATAIAFCHGILVGAWGYYVASTAPIDREICSSDTTLTRAKVADGFELLSENPMGERVIASPVPVANQLLIRGEQHLFSVGP